MTAIEEQTRAQRAAELLENETLKQALEAIESEVVRQWGECPARDKDGKEALWQLYKTAQKFRNLLNGYVETGKLATENLRRHDEQSKIRRLFGR
jgi:hypothetical protein